MLRFLTAGESHGQALVAILEGMPAGLAIDFDAVTTELAPSLDLQSLIERFFSKLKHFRRVATRYDKLAANFLAMIQLATMRLWLRAYESTA